MGHINDGLSGFTLNTPQFATHLVAHRSLQVAQRFIEQENFGIRHQCPTNRNTLQLTRAQLRRFAFELVAEREKFRHLGNLSVDLRLLHFADL